MDFKAIDLSLRGFTQQDKTLLDLLSGSDRSALAPGNSASPSAGEMLAAIEAHKSVHGIAIGCIVDGHDEVPAVGGFHYLNDVATYELVYRMLPGYERRAAHVVEYLVFEAFSELGMDKICARVHDGSAKEDLLRENGFVCLGERVFADDGHELIWRYYELENDNNMIAPTRAGATSSDWDSIF